MGAALSSKQLTASPNNPKQFYATVANPLTADLINVGKRGDVCPGHQSVDAVLGFELLKPGGVMIFDDYLWESMPRPIERPKIAVDAFLAAYADKLEVLQPRGWQIAIRKK